MSARRSTLAATFSQGLHLPETVIWVTALGLTAMAAVAGRFAPGDPMLALVGKAGSFLADAADALAGISLLIAGIFALRLWLSRNPAEALTGAVALMREAARQDGGAYLRWGQDDRDRWALCRLNATAFERSVRFKAGLDEKLARNLPLMAKNPQAFAFVRSGGEDIGLSIVIPLTENFYRRYVRGGLSDHDLLPEMLPDAKEAAGGIPLFAIGLDPKYEAQRGKVRDLRHVNALIFAHVAHLKAALADHGDDLTPIVVQAEKGSIIRLLRAVGFVTLPRPGADGGRIMHTTLRQLSRRLDKY